MPHKQVFRFPLLGICKQQDTTRCPQLQLSCNKVQLCMLPSLRLVNNRQLLPAQELMEGFSNQTSNKRKG
jgi:hypothetical protein